MKDNIPLIVGAGPVGLSAALFLKNKNIDVRLIDKLPEASTESKAFGINPRTLSLLESTGATELFLQNGRKVKAVNIHRHNRCIARGNFSSIHHRFPFMLIQSQADSESIMTDLLSQKGIRVERNEELVKLTADGPLMAQVKNGSGTETIKTRLLFAADGAHSTVRELLHLNFKGGEFGERWTLYDVEMHLPAQEDEAHLFVPDNGILFAVRLKDKVWRLAGNVKQPFQLLPKETQIGKVIWESEFKISHRIIQTFQKDKIFFGGDAAHVHSPLGARGMNLGIEDAYVFSELLAKEELDQYQQMRCPVVKDTVKKIRFLTNLARARTPVPRFLHRFSSLALPVFFPFVERKLSRFVLGINYPLTALKK